MTSSKLIKTNAEWKSLLTPEQYSVTREKGTERPFSGLYHSCSTPGIYNCICCNQELFDSMQKFESGTGWPSYWQPIQENAVTTEEDQSFGMLRIEVICSKCDAHLGHVFQDGPEPTGLRYCINSASITLKAKE